MKERIWAIVKTIFTITKNIVVGILLVWMAISIVDIKTEINVVQEQNKQAYAGNATVFSSIIRTFQSFGEYIQILAKKVQNISEDIARPSYDYMKNRTVYLVQKYGEEDAVSIGTGVIIKITENSTYILTNKHVCDFADGTICFVYENNSKYRITPIKKSELDYDMQVVKMDAVLTDKEAVIGIKDVLPQDKVFMVGNNGGNPFMYAEGTISGFMRGTNDLLVGMPSGPGNSGSGIFTQDGYLAGLLYAGQLFPSYPFGASMDNSHGICVNSQVLRLFLSEYFE